MPSYKKMYIDLFNSVTDAIEILQKAQQVGEKAYVESGEPPLALMRSEIKSSETKE